MTGIVNSTQLDLSPNFQAFKIADVCPGPDSDETQEGKLKRLKQFKAAEKRANARCYAFVSSDTARLSYGYDLRGLSRSK